VRSRVSPWLLPALILAGVLAAGPSAAELISRSYLFKEGVTLRIGERTPDGIRLDDVRFGTRRLVRSETDVMLARVSVSNEADMPIDVGVAVALFDEQDRLLGVASGGPLSIRPEKSRVLNLTFEGVGFAASRAATFQISVESP
jgi:hypothetical protein